MTEWIELFRAIVRPFIIIWGFIAYTVCIVLGIEAPMLLQGMVAAVIAEYFGERALSKRSK